MNRLGQESSPYLLQHKDNPVHWFPWGDEAFQLARSEDKPIFLSVGYSTCYWCHVMEKDSFEQVSVAEILNQHFVCIKVDREERPDIDAIYMDVLVTLTGHGGWPMSVFLTPELTPFFAGTFFRQDQFILLLQRISAAWKAERETIMTSASSIIDFIRRHESSTPDRSELNAEVFSKLVSDLIQDFDSEFGGFGSAPKFPPCSKLALLLCLSNSHSEALNMCVKTLDAMARGGLFDHLGGGFARYSTDEKWLVPHFEKMLYDNAELARVYAAAFRLTKNNTFAIIATRTLDYVLREMTDRSGGFHSAQDAGEVEAEGEYYLWTLAEIQSLLGEEIGDAFATTYGVTTSGNFEGKNVLHLPKHIPWESRQKLAEAEAKLFQSRLNRQQPHLDDKILTSWNGLMISTLAFAGNTFNDPRYLIAAEGAAAFIVENVKDRSNRLLHSYCKGRATVPAFLDDYAFFIQGLIELYQMTGNQKWIYQALQLQQQQDELFWDSSGGYYFTSEEDSSVIVRKKNFMDGATPPGNAVAALNLLKLEQYFCEPSYGEKVNLIFAASAKQALSFPVAFTSLLSSYHFSVSTPKVVALLYSDDNDPALAEMQRLINSNYFPSTIIARASIDEAKLPSTLPIFQGKTLVHGKTTAYVCETGTCLSPVTEPELLLEAIKNSPTRQ